MFKVNRQNIFVFNLFKVNNEDIGTTLMTLRLSPYRKL